MDRNNGREAMEKDVAIIGGSAAGLFTAKLLAHQGLNVRVFDAEDSIDPFARTLIVTDRIKDVLGSLCNRAAVNEIHRFELFADGRIATILLQRPDLILERSILIRGLKAQAEASGAKVLTGMRFLSLKPNGEDLTFILLRNGKEDVVEESANIVVGADGASSEVAQSAGWPPRPTASLIQAVVELPKDMSPDTARVWFVPEETPYFFWLIPHSAANGVVGVIGDEERESRTSLERFLEKRSLVPAEFQSAQVSRYTRWVPNHKRIGESDVYLVGDAASHVKLSTVGGLITGFRGALGVAEAILNGGLSREFWSLRHDLNLHLLIRKVLSHFTQADYARLLDLLTPSVMRSLSRFNRDESKKLLLHAFLKEPRLLLLGLRALLHGKLLSS